MWPDGRCHSNNLFVTFWSAVYFLLAIKKFPADRQVKRIKKFVNWELLSWFITKLSELTFKEMYENINENNQFELGDEQNAWMTDRVRGDHAKFHKIS